MGNKGWPPTDRAPVRFLKIFNFALKDFFVRSISNYPIKQPIFIGHPVQYNTWWVIKMGRRIGFISVEVYCFGVVESKKSFKLQS